jgi:hypothetical protein
MLLCFTKLKKQYFTALNNESNKFDFLIHIPNLVKEENFCVLESEYAGSCMDRSHFIVFPHIGSAILDTKNMNDLCRFLC